MEDWNDMLKMWEEEDPRSSLVVVFSGDRGKSEEDPKGQKVGPHLDLDQVTPVYRGEKEWTPPPMGKTCLIHKTSFPLLYWICMNLITDNTTLYSIIFTTL